MSWSHDPMYHLKSHSSRSACSTYFFYVIFEELERTEKTKNAFIAENVIFSRHMSVFIFNFSPQQVQSPVVKPRSAVAGSSTGSPENPASREVQKVSFILTTILFQTLTFKMDA